MRKVLVGFWGIPKDCRRRVGRRECGETWFVMGLFGSEDVRGDVWNEDICFGNGPSFIVKVRV